MNQGIAHTDRNTVAAENATAVRDLFGKSFWIESQGFGWTNRNACAILFAQTLIDRDLTHN
jgi:hypothetical protein